MLEQISFHLEEKIKQVDYFLHPGTVVVGTVFAQALFSSP
jgi:hypothetical protein